MSMFTREIAELLHNAGVGVFTTTNPESRTIFVGEATEIPTEYLLLVPVPSPPPHEYIDTEYPIIDIWARSPHSDRAYSMLEQVYEILHRKHHYTTGNWYVHFSRALGTIVDADRDLENGKVLRLSVQFLCRNLTHIS